MVRLQRRLGRRLGPIVMSVAALTFLYYVFRASASPFVGRPTSLSPSSDDLASEDPSAPLRHVPSSFDWARRRPRYPVHELAPLPAGEPHDLPPVQRPDISVGDAQTQKTMASRRDAVKELFLQSWVPYRELAFGMDELGPVSGKGKTTFGGWAATLVDALDTLLIMGLDDEFRVAARAACALDFGKSPSSAANVFETTIRHLGGLLAAYDLGGSTEPALLSKAVELGNMLYAAFDTPNRMPVFWLRFTDVRTPAGWQLAGTREPIAAGASLCLEFTRLAQITGDTKFFDAVERVKDVLVQWQKGNETWIPGLWPAYVDWRNKKAKSTVFSLGAGADSLYEYLPKMFALLGGRDAAYAEMTVGALDAARDNMLFRPMLPDSADVLFLGDATVRIREDVAVSVKLEAQVQHLGCFAGGMYALAGRLLLREDYVDVGRKLALGCAWAYEAMPTGIMAEIAAMMSCTDMSRELQPPAADKSVDEEQAEHTHDHQALHIQHKRAAIPPPTSSSADFMASCPWDERRWATNSARDVPRGFQRVRDPRYILRPEAIESIFYLWRITGDEVYRDKAWAMFEAIRAATGAKYGNGAIDSVLARPAKEGEKENWGKGHGVKVVDSMESFWFSETLKYFYLVFSSPDTLSLDEWVFNTEAHPFRRPKRMDKGA